MVRAGPNLRGLPSAVAHFGSVAPHLPRFARRGLRPFAGFCCAHAAAHARIPDPVAPAEGGPESEAPAFSTRQGRPESWFPGARRASTHTQKLFKNTVVIIVVYCLLTTRSLQAPLHEEEASLRI